MTKLLGIRTVYDIDPTKTFRIADILESGAILPHSVHLADLMVMDLEPADDCCCLEFMGDSKNCETHGGIFEDGGEFSAQDEKDQNDLYTIGMGA